MSGRADEVWVVRRADPPSAPPDRLVRAAERVGLRVRLVDASGDAAVLRSSLEREPAPATAVLAPDLPSPLPAARVLHRMAPLVQLILLVEGDAQAFRERMPVAPMIGNHWTVVSLRDDLGSALHAAARATGQRRRLRTTLDRVNLELSSRATADSAEYRQLVVSDRYLASILEYAEDAIVSIDWNGTIASWNRGAERLFGRGEADAVGRPATVLVVDASREELNALLAGARLGTPTERHEMRCRRADGDTVDAEITLAPVRDASGRTVAVSAIARDVTERKRFEGEIHALNEDLERRVRERTAQLQASVQDLEAFSYSVSHDLRSPLRGIDGYSHVLLEDYGEGAVVDDTAREYLERIRADAQRMGAIIDDLLEFARLGRTRLRRGQVDLSGLAHEIGAQLAADDPSRTVHFEVEPRVRAHGDERLLKLALENLLANAWKFTRDREEARVAFGAEHAEGERVFFVCDNGAGFDMQFAGKLFMPFQRLHSADRYQGTGIGLATVQRIVHGHGGRIWAHSEPGRGATFYFTVPAGAGSGRDR